MNRATLTGTNAAMHYTLSTGRVLEVEVIARLEMSPGQFDDGTGIIVCTAADVSGYVVFRVGALMAAGEDFTVWPTLPDAYAFALICARQDADNFLEACRLAIEEDDDDPMGTHHGSNS